MDFLKKINFLFSGDYANPNSAPNIILLWMYKLSFPITITLSYLNLSPNQVTTISLISAIIACVSLVVNDGWTIFVIFWVTSVVLDLCDGTLARMKNKKSKSAFRYDHMSDLFKIYLLSLSIGLYFMNTMIWILTTTASSLYLYNMVLVHDLQNIAIRTIDDKKQFSESIIQTIRLRERFSLIAYIAKFRFIERLYKAFHSIFLNINGHTYLAFTFLPISLNYAKLIFSYLIFISILNGVLNIKNLNQYTRPSKEKS